MRDRIEQILRLVCLGLALILLGQLIRAGFRADPLAHAQFPPVPTLQTMASSNAVAGTNISQPKSNAPMAADNSANTNRVVTVTAAAPATNWAGSGTNTTVTANPSHLIVSATNMPARQIAPDSGAMPPSQGLALPGRFPGGFPMGGPPGMGGPPAPLPPAIQARVDKIVNSEIFAPILRPQPMQLFGIAGHTAFLRTDSGQTGLVKEGDSLGDLKLLRIGINRVLVEQNGQKKELMIFEGYGGQSLLPK